MNLILETDSPVSDRGFVDATLVHEVGIFEGLLLLAQSFDLRLFKIEAGSMLSNWPVAYLEGRICAERGLIKSSVSHFLVVFKLYITINFRGHNERG